VKRAAPNLAAPGDDGSALVADRTVMFIPPRNPERAQEAAARCH